MIKQNTLPGAEDFERYSYNGKIAGSASFQKNRNRRRKKLESEQALAPASISKATVIDYSDDGLSEKPRYEEGQNSVEDEDDGSSEKPRYEEGQNSVEDEDDESSEKPRYEEEQNSGEDEDDENIDSQSPKHMPSGQYRRYKRLKYTQSKTSRYRCEKN